MYEIQSGVYDMTELLVDLIAARLSHAPVPIALLETLVILFDPDTIFQCKHKGKLYDHSLYDEQLGARLLAIPPSSSRFSLYDPENLNDPRGWLCQIINRFVFKDGIINLKRHFQSGNPLTAHVGKSMSIDDGMPTSFPLLL
jgi:ubiquitin carboxyl-terminal hydrolase 9/24